MKSKPMTTAASAKRIKRAADTVAARQVAETDADKRRRLADMLRNINAGLDTLNANAETLRRRLS